MAAGVGVGFERGTALLTRQLGQSVQSLAYASGRVNQQVTSPRTFNRTVNNSSQSSTTRNMPITIVTAANSQDTLASMALFAAMGQI
jgi:hypothetical protein